VSKLLTLRDQCVIGLNAISDPSVLEMINSTIRHLNDPENWTVRVSITRRRKTRPRK
jgi:hypothetical protein